MRKWLTYILLLAILIVSGQDNHFVNVSATPGFLLAHRADLLGLATHNYGLEVSYEQNKYSSHWGAAYKKPSIGYGILYYNLGKQETGHAFGLLTHVKLNIISLGKSDIRFRMGAGLAYLTKKFDVYENRRNQAIGSHFNGSMQFGLIGHSPFLSKSYLEYGISISHYSNAAFKVPNLGYNIPSVTLRYGFGLGTMDEDESKCLEASVNKLDWRAVLIYGKKERNFGNPINFYNYGVQLRGIKNVSNTKAWRFGVDYTLDKTYKYSENSLVALDSITIIEQSELAVAAGFQWNFGRVDVIAEIGAYVYKPAVLKNALSQRMGLSYTLNKHWNAQGTLRFHRGVADFFEIGIGYTL
ncbi:MAG: acyloxyacyl hydrolase [Bacteroidetes bacterium]|nr:acyloxyacyl hydrolase [Bacteroidota bacterium]